ncbi:glycerophosphodiester phosphodiesterase family protein [Myroides odoratimimus]|uniref:glycerophosphodiester phosphodiesterase family protein n=1 Tax=Myroides odoratimimus TaxID=76832 RepID=UPI0038D4307C
MMKLIKYLLCYSFLLKVMLCVAQHNPKEKVFSISNQLTENKVLVVSHRGDWRDAPENSLLAIKNCIDMGVQMVEIDVRRTRDGEFILLHDNTLDRTTTGKGKVEEWSLSEIQQLFLRDGAGHATGHRIPTLKEALMTSKDRVLINLDKCYNHLDEIYPLLVETETVDQVVIKGKIPYRQLESDYGHLLNKIAFMPIVDANKEGALEIVKEYTKAYTPIAVEVVFKDYNNQVKMLFKELHKEEIAVWVNSLWPELNGGYHDDRAIRHTEEVYGWYINNRIKLIQTDRPRLLLAYLKNKTIL